MKLAQNVTRIAAAAYASAIALLVIWGAWLLLTGDPDGGRHPVGGAMLIAALVFTLLGLFALRRVRHLSGTQRLRRQSWR